MVARSLFKRFRRDTGGVVLVEALMSLPIVVLMITAMVELGFALFQWNQTVRAVQLGARLAAVSSPVFTDEVASYTTPLSAGFTDGGRLVGDPVPQAIVSVSCGSGTTACDTAKINRIVYGPDGVCTGTEVGTAAGMCDIAPWIARNGGANQHVRITYTRAGLGYVGRPYGVVTTVTVEVRNLAFDFILLDAFFALAGNANTGITIPAHPVTVTSEDMSSCGELSDTWPAC